VLRRQLRAVVGRQVVTELAAARRYVVHPRRPGWRHGGVVLALARRRGGAAATCLGSVAWRRGGARLLRKGERREVTAPVECRLCAVVQAAASDGWPAQRGRRGMRHSWGAAEKQRFHSIAYGCRRKRLSVIVIRMCRDRQVQWGRMLRAKALWRRCLRTSLSPLGASSWSYTFIAPWSLGENPVHCRRAMVASLTSYPPWRRRLLRPASVAVFPVHFHGCSGCFGNSVVRQSGRGLYPSRWRQRLSCWWLRVAFCCRFVYLQRTAAAGIGAIVSAVRDYVD
jgi:hypothetical protein